MKIICVGRNYAAHAQELNNPLPDAPLLFMKPPSALLVNGKPFYYPSFSKDIHYECELVLRIGKNGKCIEEQFAHRYVRDVTLGIDFTARDIQDQCKQKGHPWEIAKAFDHSAPLGEFQELPGDWEKNGFQFQFFKNGNLVQNGDSKWMLFSIPKLLAYISQYFKLQLGDLIFTGTPAGVGPIAIGDHFEGTLFGQKTLVCDIK